MSVCVCVCACELPYGEKWEEIGGPKRRKGRSASSVAVFQIEICDFSPEKRAAWIFKMPFGLGGAGKECHCHFHLYPWVWACLSSSKQNDENGGGGETFLKVGC